MNTCLFLSFACDAGAPVSEMAKLDDLICTAPRLVKALLHTPASTRDPYVDDGPPPSLILQLYFAELPALEAVLSRDGHLSSLVSPAEFPSLAAADVGQQAMLVREFAVAEPAFNSPGSPYSTYLVSYQGEAEDLNAWHAYYLENHTKLMAMFPDIRELEVYTRLDWVSRQPWLRLNFMQRNKVAFDSLLALDRALNSPVRQAMRACFKAFPRFSGPTRHYAMATRLVQPQRGLASKR
jgi:hypothetical protein